MDKVNSSSTIRLQLTKYSWNMNWFPVTLLGTVCRKKSLITVYTFDNILEKSPLLKLFIADLNKVSVNR